jgi:hypothetical protein
MSYNERKKEPLLRSDEVTWDNLQSSEGQVAISQALITLLCEVSAEENIPLTQKHDVLLQKSRVFSNLADYFHYCEALTQDKLSWKDKMALYTAALFCSGFVEEIHDVREGTWVPVAYVRSLGFAGQREYTQVVLHELAHIADKIVLPQDRKKDRMRESVNKQLLLSALVIGLSDVGEILLLAGGLRDELPLKMLFASLLFSGLTGLSAFARYRFGKEERRAHQASRRLRD